MIIKEQWLVEGVSIRDGGLLVEFDSRQAIVHTPDGKAPSKITKVEDGDDQIQMPTGDGRAFAAEIVTKCPGCGRVCECHTAIGEGDTPTPGALSICFYCAAIGIYTDDLTLRVATDSDLEGFSPEGRELIVRSREEIGKRNHGVGHA